MAPAAVTAVCGTTQRHHVHDAGDTAPLSSVPLQRHRVDVYGPARPAAGRPSPRCSRGGVQPVAMVCRTDSWNNERSETVQELRDIPGLGALEPLSEHGGVRCALAMWEGRTVFVKTLTVDYPDAIVRFQHEGRVAASLNHPLVVSPLAATTRQLVFPFIEGGTLRECLDRGPLTPAHAIEVALGILNAVDYLHAQGVTHHDVKPENILLSRGQPGFWNVRLIDFGMSHSRALPLDIHSGTRMGTPHFMAPEQFRGIRGDPRSDLYSVGVLLFDCLAGHPPFEDALGWLEVGS